MVRSSQGVRFAFTIAAAVILSLSGACLLEAQATRATILGTITDSTGAAVAGATVQTKNIDTNTTETAKTDAQGRYSVPDLPIGNYEVQVSNPGFQTFVRRGITLNVGSQSVVDVALAVGQTQQTLTVEAAASRVETQSAAVGQLVSSVQMRELPLNGRNFEQLILLAPGVQQIQPSGGSFYGQGANYSIAGSRPEGQAFLLDNTDISNFWNHGTGSGAIGSSLGIESINEFQTVTNTYSAQFGGNGAVVNAITKSGTNAIHGSAYEFLRNSVLDARNFFDAGKPPFRRNQFGGSVGGPIKKDKLFFFVNYEGLRQLLGESRVAFVPDAASRVGAAPNIAPTLSLYPLPTTAIGGGIGTVVNSANQLAHENYLLARGDWTISSANSLFMRYVSDRADFTEPFSGSAIPLWPELDLSRNQYGTIEDRQTISPTMVNIARISFVRPTESAAITNNLPQLDFFPGSGRENGAVVVTGLSTIGATTTLPFNIVQNRFTYADEMYWTHGAHTIAFGLSVTRTQNNVFAPFEIGGTYTFNSLQDFVHGNAYTLLGALPSAGDATRDFRELLFAPYFNDQWKVRPNLTLNLGLRYQPTTNPVGVRHEVTALPNAPFGTGFVDVKNAFANNPSFRNWDPRIGFSYSPFKDNKTVIRGGFGIFHDVIVARAYVTAYVLSPPDTLGLQVAPPYPAAFSGGGAALPPSEFEAIDYQTKNTPYMMQYNFNIQRDLGQNTVLTLGYVGSRGVHLFAMRDVNAPVPTIDSNGNYRFASIVNGALVSNPRVNPAFGQISSRAPIGDSNYNSFQLNLNRQLTKNLQAQISYTWAKSIDDNSISFGLEGGGAPQNFSNPFNAAYDRGRSTFDLTHSFRLSSVYLLPMHGSQLVEGWQLSGILSATSGFPFTAYTGFDQTGLLGGGTPRPNLNPGCVSPIVGNVNEWYNPSCFSLQAPGTLGNLGRDNLVGPNFFDLDLAIMKDTAIRKISEQFRVQFRAEAFNLLNHPNFSLPNQNVFTQTTVGNGTINPQAGTITSTVPNNQREIQFAVKVIF